MANTCPICKKPTFLVYGKYPRKDGLCKECSQKLFNGEILQCENCGNWHYVFEVCKCQQKTSKTTKNSDESTKCVICGEDSHGYPQCKNCYYETLDFMDTLDKNDLRKLRDHYYNLKERILIINTPYEAQKQCKRLIAIAMLAEDIYDDTSLIDRVYKNVEDLLKKKQKFKENVTYEEERKENDQTKGKLNVSQDGHTVDSDMEVRIDDILYNACILHCYGKSIDEIREKRKKCDWFIPILNGKGIYIEYWGMKTEKYREERAEKEELYKKYDIPYISIEADDPKKDTSTFRSNLIRDLTNLAVERYGFMPEWKR
jgi:hypothetical protein